MGSSCAVVAVAVAVVLLFAATAVAVDKHCFDACFDQCVPRNEFWFCQFSCYDKCGSAAHVAGAGDLDCEHSCILSLCGQLDPGSKMMVACRDTCRKKLCVYRLQEWRVKLTDAKELINGLRLKGAVEI